MRKKQRTIQKVNNTQERNKIKHTNQAKIATQKTLPKKNKDNENTNKQTT